MKITKYKNLKEAIVKTTKDSTEHIFLRHVLNPGDKIRLHYHRKANEYIIIDNRSFKVRSGNDEISPFFTSSQNRLKQKDFIRKRFL